ncbi:hypothetical protein EV201_1253 [Ancylomarina subtilis]|uniref:Uncharacterized protein n=1 Tax=Ancylomarina subtilis TaxID=1639035 RepID=A0A4Q7VK92_9BACT|nr:hypothetical protein [Ancylomarina subtilis]RZT96612.1 hypothetical protein EV201_1253 [Ancylomarina subtilis]
MEVKEKTTKPRKTTAKKPTEKAELIELMKANNELLAKIEKAVTGLYNILKQ